MPGLEWLAPAILAAIGGWWLAFRRGRAAGRGQEKAERAEDSLAAERKRQEIDHDIAQDTDLAARARRSGLVRHERR